MKFCLKCRRDFASPGWSCPACGQEPGPGPSSAFDARLFAMLARLEPTNFWFRSRNRLILWALRLFLPETRKFLEVGCGTGFVLAAIADAFPRIEVYGSEASADGLSYADSRAPRARLFPMNILDMPFREEFDAIGAFDVLEHLDDDEAVLRAVARALKPGGGLIATVPQHRFLWSEIDVFSGHRRRYEPAELEAKARAAGLSVVLSTSFVSLLLPLVFASRRRYRKEFGERDADSELATGGLAGFLLEAALGLELRLIELGVRFPFGSSRLIVARKLK
jgi:SAM-dependent methyltransferase